MKVELRKKQGCLSSIFLTHDEINKEVLLPVLEEGILGQGLSQKD
jgi:hypothetical protein